jgi:hypothetical protein
MRLKKGKNGPNILENLPLTISENTKFDVLVKSQKNDLFTRVFCLWYLVFGVTSQ